MPYHVELTHTASEYLFSVTEVSRESIEEMWQEAERKLGEDADVLHLRNQKPPGAQTFEYETIANDGITQYLFRFIATMAFAAQGVIRIEYVDHEIIGTIGTE